MFDLSVDGTIVPKVKIKYEIRLAKIFSQSKRIFHSKNFNHKVSVVFLIQYSILAKQFK